MFGENHFFRHRKGTELFHHQPSGLFSSSSEWRRWHRWKWSDHYSPAVRPDDRDVTLCVAPSADLLYHVAKADCDDIASCSKTIVLRHCLFVNQTGSSCQFTELMF